MADEIQAFLELDDSKWTAGIQRAGQSLRRFQDEADRSFKDLEKAAGNPFGNLASGIASLGLDRLAGQLGNVAKSIVAPFGAAGSAATNFEAEMRNVNSVAQLSEGQFAAFSDKIAGLGRELNLGVGPAEAAAGAYDIVSAGFTDAASAEAILRESLRGSKAGLTEVATASDLLTTAIAAYGLTAQDASKVNDILFQTVASGKTTYEELAQSFGQVATIASQNGVTLEELGASIALLTQRGLKTPEAINAIKAAIVQLGSPTEEAIKAQKAFGLNINQSTIKQKGLIATLNEVTAATKGNTTAQRQILGDVTALNAALGLTSDGGTKFVKILGDMENASGSTDKALAQQQQSLKANLDKFNTSLERAGVAATKIFLPALTKIVQVGTGVVDFFTGLPQPVQAGIVIVGGLTAGMVALAAGALAVATALGSAVTGLAAIGGSAVAVSAGIAVVSGAAAFAVEVFLALEAAMVAAAGAGAVVVGATVAMGAAIAGALVGLVLMTEGMKENNKIAAEALALDERRAAALRESKSLLEQNAEQIVKSGKGSKDFVDVIGGLQDQLEAARAAGNQPLVARLQDQIRDAQNLKKEVTQLEATTGSATDSAITLNQRLSDVTATQKDALAEEIHAINLSNQSDRDKADSLERLIGMFRLEGDERRKIETDVARLRKTATAEEEKGAQSLIQAQIKLSDVKIEGWQKDLAAGKDVGKQLEEDIKRRTALEIQAIQDKAKAQLEAEADPTRRTQIQDTATLDEAAARQKGDQQVAAARKATDDEATKRAKERIDAELQQNKIAQDALDKRMEGLQREAQLGRDNFAEQAQIIEQKADLQAEALRKAAEQAAREAKDPAVKSGILSNADAEIANVKKQSELDLQQIAKDSADQKLANSSRELGLVKQIKDAQIGALKQQASEGKNVTEQLRKALLDRLSLQEQEIRLQAEAAKAATNSASEQALIEQDAQTKIIAARIAARKEIDSTIAALEKQKAAQDSLSGVGDMQSLEQFIQSQSDQFGIGSTRKRIAQQQANNRSGQAGRNISGLATRAQDLLDASTGPFPTPGTVATLTKTPDQAKTLASKQQAQAAITAQAGARALAGGGSLGTVSVLVGVDPNNGQIEIESTKAETTANGRGSRLELVAGTLSSRSNVGGV